MSMKQLIDRVALVFLLVGLVPGCTGYGKVSSQTGPGEGMEASGEEVKIQDLRENWRDYHISYAVIYGMGPGAIMFDPINDGKTLQNDKWVKVEDQETLLDIINYIQESRSPIFTKVLGPDNQFYGYIFYAYKHHEMEIYIFTKAVNANTLRVEGAMVKASGGP